MRAWLLIAVGLVVAVAALAAPPFIQLQKDLRAARARNTELESVIANLKKELDVARQARTELQGNLEEATTEIEKRQLEIERLAGELKKAKDAAALNQQRNSASEPSENRQPQLPQ
jgi:septal ring factor EnvC (AmiA/AmiB activator)